MRLDKHPYFYQWTHWWHWLGYGQNATVAQVFIALLALIGLFFYTLYTRRMLNLQLATRRAEISPVFSIRNVNFRPYLDIQDSYGQLISSGKLITLHLEVRNIGRGPALMIEPWHGRVSAGFQTLGSTFYTPTEASIATQAPQRDLMTGEAIKLHFEPVDPNQKWLFVVPSIDMSGGKHQIKVVRAPNGEAEISMTHKMNDSKGEAIVALAQRVREIYVHTRAAIFKRRP